VALTESADPVRRTLPRAGVRGAADQLSVGRPAAFHAKGPPTDFCAILQSESHEQRGNDSRTCGRSCAVSVPRAPGPHPSRFPFSLTPGPPSRVSPGSRKTTPALSKAAWIAARVLARGCSALLDILDRDFGNARREVHLPSVDEKGVSGHGKTRSRLFDTCKISTKKGG
jgi:hypothetical protein